VFCVFESAQGPSGHNSIEVQRRGSANKLQGTPPTLRGHYFYTNVCNGCSSATCAAHLPCCLFKHCKAVEVGVSTLQVSAVANITANSMGPEQPCANKGGNCASCQPCKKCCSVRLPNLLRQFFSAVTIYTFDVLLQIGHAAKDSHRSNCVELATKTTSILRFALLVYNNNNTRGTSTTTLSLP
jgi:hypothetical protein